MAQVKLLKIDSDGIPVEMNTTSDDITLNSFTVQGGGPVLSGSGLDMNNQDISDIKNVSFNSPSSNTINGYVVNDYMVESKENSMDVGAAILFPSISNAVGEVDAFRLPALAGTPTAAPADGGEGYLIWDSTNDKLYAWTGTVWDDLTTVTSANQIINSYTADEALTLGDTLYISAANNVSKGVVSSSGAASQIIGLAKANASDTAAVDVVSEGVFTGFTGLTAGARYYADPATAGGKTTSVPTGSGNTIVQLGYAKSTTELHLHIQQLGRRA